MKNAWATTNGVSGKICMVLFYAVIVGKIAWAIKDLIYPKVCMCYYVRRVENLTFDATNPFAFALFSNRCDYYFLLFRVLSYTQVGWECFHQGLTPYEDEVITMLTRTLAVLTIGFYCLAGYNGIGVMNTFFVFAINAAFGWIMFTTHPIVLLSGDTVSGAPSCNADIDRVIIITQVFLWTSLVAFNFAFFEVILVDN